MLNDTNLRKWGDMRNCDMAVYTLQYATDQNFGIEQKQTVAERDRAVEKAKIWVREKAR
jgi:hypothetical protein